MRLFGFGLAFLCMAVVGTADAQTVTVLDDFNGPGGGSGFTQTVILDTDASTPAATTTLDPNLGIGVGEFNTVGLGDIEQSAWVFAGQSLAIGETLALDLNVGGNQDIGIFVADTALTAASLADSDTRDDLVVSFARNATQAANAVFDDTFPGGNTGNLGGSNFPFSGVFITHTAADSFDLGFIDGTGAFVTERSFVANGGNSGSVIGIYTDIRANGNLGDFDNFRIISPVPEPTSMMVLGLAGGIATLRRRRR